MKCCLFVEPGDGSSPIVQTQVRSRIMDDGNFPFRRYIHILGRQKYAVGKRRARRQYPKTVEMSEHTLRIHAVQGGPLGAGFETMQMKRDALVAGGVDQALEKFVGEPLWPGGAVQQPYPRVAAVVGEQPVHKRHSLGPVAGIRLPLACKQQPLQFVRQAGQDGRFILLGIYDLALILGPHAYGGPNTGFVVCVQHRPDFRFIIAAERDVGLDRAGNTVAQHFGADQAHKRFVVLRAAGNTRRDNEF